MLFVLIILIMIITASSKAASKNEFITEYLSISNTLSIKGIFVILVIFQHYSQYVSLSSDYDKPFLALQSHLNQLIVAMFLFYSGFGIMEQIRTKGFAYVKTVPTKRFLKLLLNFDIAVTLFLILKFCLGSTFPIQKILLSYIGWESLGNSNWYIFVTLVLYLLVFASFFLIKWLNNNGGRLIGCIVITLLTIAFVYWQMSIGRPNYTYNTAIIFPLGCWYSLFKPQIDGFVMKNDYFYSFICFVSLIVYLWSYYKRWTSIETYSVWAITFTLMIVFFTMKISINSNILNWFGSHVFSVYILQRIPMIILQHFGFADKRYLFLIVSIISTIFISMVYDYLTDKLFNKIWRKSKTTLTTPNHA